MNIPTPDGCELMPFQREGIEWAMRMFGLGQNNVLVGDEMGLGKTVQALGILNCLRWRKAIIVCPASLRLNWKREAEKWLVTKPAISVVDDADEIPDSGLIICSYDFLIERKFPNRRPPENATEEWHHRQAELKAAFDARQKAIKDRIINARFDVQIVDEAHCLKNKASKRTKATLAMRCANFAALSGTPMLNAPYELWPLAHKCAPKLFPNWWRYANRYCGMTEVRFNSYQGEQVKHDWRGASNLAELNQKLKTFMIRRLKRDVLKDLPPKTRQVIELPPTKEMRIVLNRENMQWKPHEEVLAKLVARRDEAQILSDEAAYRNAVMELKAATAAAWKDMARVRQEVALAKLPLCIAHIQDGLESEDKVVVFGHHIAVVDNLMEELKGFNPVKIMGEDSSEDRQAAADAFQNDPKCRVIVGGLGPMGVGWTLTKARWVVFCEESWTPALISQAEDRCHRIGQKDSVLAQHLVLEASLDAYMLKNVINKQNIIDQAIDAAGGNVEEAKKKMKVSYSVEGAKYNRDQRAMMIKCLRVIADKDNDSARQRNGEGFSMYHSQIGKSLAGKWELTDAEAGFAAMLVKRYRGQVDSAMVKLTGVL